MFAPLNGAPLNGSASGLWVSADVSVLAESTAENRIYSAAGATATTTAQSTGNSVRLSLFEGGKLARSTIGIEATRFASFEGAFTANASTEITLARTAWVEAALVSGNALTTGSTTRLAKVLGAVIGNATGALDNNALSVYRLVKSKNVTSQARTWLAESNLDVLRVKQSYVAADAIGRSRSRALVNTALGRSKLVLDAESNVDPLGVSTVRSAVGISTGTLEATSVAARIRIIEAGMISVAEIRNEPTITTVSGRYSYNSGVLSGRAAENVSNQIHRRPGYSVTRGESVASLVKTFLQKGVQGTSTGNAIIGIGPRSNNWLFGKSSVYASASLVSAWQHYRWREISGSSTAESFTQSENLHYRPTEIGSFLSEADSEGVCLAIRPVENAESVSSISTSTSDNIHTAFGYDLAGAQAVLEIEAYGRRGRLMSGVQESYAESSSDGLKAVWRTGKGDANASVIRFIYRINAGEMAPDERSLLLTGSNREIVLPTSNREYRIQ